MSREVAKNADSAIWIPSIKPGDKAYRDSCIGVVPETVSRGEDVKRNRKACEHGTGNEELLEVNPCYLFELQACRLLE